MGKISVRIETGRDGGQESTSATKRTIVSTDGRVRRYVGCVESTAVEFGVRCAHPPNDQQTFHPSKSEFRNPSGHPDHRPRGQYSYYYYYYY